MKTIHQRLGVIGLAFAAALLAGCANAPISIKTPVVQNICAPGETSAEIVRLFFGRNVGAAPGVSETDWDSFLEKEVMSRFPEGLSVIDTAGVWRGRDGMAVHELGKAVVIVLSGEADETRRLDAVRAAYKARFAQESLLTSKSQACVAL